MAWVAKGFRYDCPKCGARIGGMSRPLDDLTCQCGATLRLVLCDHPVVKKLAGNMTCRKCHAIVEWQPDTGVIMSMTKCKDCGAAISRTAEACPQCGAKIRRTHWITWMVAGLIGVGVIGAMVGGSSDPPPPEVCPPMDPATLWLPDDKAYATIQFLDRARRIHESGECLIDAGWSRDRQQYWFQVNRPGEPLKSARNVYIPEADLHR